MNPGMLEKYLAKTGLSDKPEISQQGLKQLHIAQHRTIPFENFDVFLGKPISLTGDDLFQKLIVNNRGGYCFELNGLMLSALKALGFDARPLLGRVHLSGEPSGRGHQVCLVTINEQQWLVDTGFGSQTPRHPLPLTPDTELHTDTQTYRFVKDALYGNLLQLKDEENWVSLYSLDMGHVCAGDIEYGNHYTSTSRGSVFTSSCFVTQATDDGIVTLLNNRLKTVQRDEVQEAILEDEHSYLKALQEHFGLEPNLPEQFLQRVTP